MRIVWQVRAKDAYREIAHYINERFGCKARQDFMQKVKESERLMKSHPDIGSIDPLFADRPKTYRSVIVGGLSKMVYFVEDDIIYIAAFWDCRREPEGQAEKVK